MADNIIFVDIPTEHKQQIAKLRKKAGPPEEYDDDFSLLRWLTAWDFDLNAILPRLKTTLEFRHVLGLDTVPRLPEADFQSYLIENFSPATVMYYPGGFSGYDKEGNVVIIEPLARSDPRGLVPCGRHSEFIRCRMAETERIWQLVRCQERKIGKKCGLFYIMDLEGLGKDQIWLPTMQIYIALIGLLQDHYPDLLKRLLIIKAPALLTVAYNMVYPILSKQTREKIQIVSGDQWKEKLSSLIDADQRPVFWGGTQRGTNGSPYGNIRMAGKVPPELKYNPTTNPEEPTTEELRELTVPRSDKTQFTLDFRASSSKGTKLKWFFHVKSGDIMFSIVRKDSGGSDKFTTIVPKFRLNTEYAPEFGFVICEKPGIYVMEFDNSYSMLKSKQVFYCIKTV